MEIQQASSSTNKDWSVKSRVARLPLPSLRCAPKGA
jgi:hypothetical protein